MAVRVASVVLTCTSEMDLEVVVRDVRGGAGLRVPDRQLHPRPRGGVLGTRKLRLVWLPTALPSRIGEGGAAVKREAGLGASDAVGIDRSELVNCELPTY